MEKAETKTTLKKATTACTIFTWKKAKFNIEKAIVLTWKKQKKIKPGKGRKK